MPRPDTEDQTHLVYKDFESGLVFVCSDSNTSISVMEGYEGRIIDTITYEYHTSAYTFSDHGILFKRTVVSYIAGWREKKKVADDDF